MACTEARYQAELKLVFPYPLALFHTVSESQIPQVHANVVTHIAKNMIVDLS
jgi:hypothetical protein